MPPITHTYRRFPLHPATRLPTPTHTPSHPPPSLLAHICLKLLASVAAHTQRPVTLAPDTAPLPIRLKVLGLPETSPTWDTLEQDGLIECRTTPTGRSVRLMPLGLLQAKYYLPPARPPAEQVWFHQILCHLYGSTPHPLAALPAGGTWAEVRTRYPAHWVVLEVRLGHYEGTYFLPDRVLICTAHPNYTEAHAYYQTYALSPNHLLTHTSITTLVLQPPLRHSA